MIAVNIDSKYKNLDLEGQLRKAAQIALEHLGQETGEVTLVLAGNTQIQKLNRQFRGENSVTDVLSFPADELDVESGARYLGDVVISIPQAKAQAKAAGHAVEAEVQLLVVHGVLHLLGHDHGESDERAKMWAVQDEILEKLDLPIRSVQAESRSAH